MKALEELTADIREKLPRLKELEIGMEIFVPQNNGELYSYTIIDVSVSNSFQNIKKPWEGEKLGELTTVITVKNNAISFELERYALDDLKYNGKEPMLNDVLEWFKNSQYEKGINVMHELVWSQTSEHILKLWDLSKPHLKDQSPELITFLHGLIKK